MCLILGLFLRIALPLLFYKITIKLKEGDRSEKEGLKYLESSAKHGNITAILTVANTYHRSSLTEKFYDILAF